jgi:hypothetical protein
MLIMTSYMNADLDDGGCEAFLQDEIWGSHSADDKHWNKLSYDAVSIGKLLPAFQKKKLSASVLKAQSAAPESSRCCIAIDRSTGDVKQGRKVSRYLPTDMASYPRILKYLC